ncbi:AraC family transcriptional regulator [Sphingomonas sp. RP10(2022)]|uniref:AraC family transcriptional regulator n=1 Tax=Sphingomonas liriopis TaxID=2949094 RepID=A0A9X2KRR7_9SPHN|nr:AraC family transcriptional regulator [Sphingomonas liriopis]MCP3735896.1 AraC family transcriptional regulator [Sphingomonas liriopis]
MTTEPAIIAERALPYGCAQIVEWRWSGPIDLTVREPRHMIEMSMPPFSTDGMAAFPALDPARFRFMGTLFMRPADVDIHARSVGGHVRVVRVTVNPDAGTAAQRLALGGERVGDGLDLRGTRLRQLMGYIRDELIRPGAESDGLVRAYADALLIETGRSIAARAERTQVAARLADWQHARVVARIDAEGPVPTLAELAALCGVSERHFTRLYRALAGESAACTIERARMRRAMALLDAGDLPIKAIAAATGFTRDSAFSAAFRRATGLPPRTWCQRRRAAAAVHRSLQGPR